MLWLLHTSLHILIELHMLSLVHLALHERGLGHSARAKSSIICKSIELLPVPCSFTTNQIRNDIECYETHDHIEKERHWWLFSKLCSLAPVVRLLLICELSVPFLGPLCVFVIGLSGILVEVVIVVVILLCLLPLLVGLLPMLVLRRVGICTLSVAIKLLPLPSHPCCLLRVKIFPTSSIVLLLHLFVRQNIVCLRYLFKSVFTSLRLTLSRIWVMLLR